MDRTHSTIINAARGVADKPFREGDVYFQSLNVQPDYIVAEEEGVWIPYENGTFNKFVMFDLARNHFSVLVRCEAGSGIAYHYHTGPVLGYTLKGQWRYKEHDWIAKPGTVVYEPCAEAHTLLVVGDEPMVTLFHVMGPHIQLDEDGKQVGYIDAYHLREYALQYYKDHGLDPEYIHRITR